MPKTSTRAASECHRYFPTECNRNFPTECHRYFPTDCHRYFPTECHRYFPTECHRYFPAADRNELSSNQESTCLSGLVCSLAIQEHMCLENYTCCQNEIEVGDQTCSLTQSRYTDTGTTGSIAGPGTPNAWQGSH